MAYAVQPVVRNFRVAVQQQHIVDAAERHAPVDGAYKTEVVFIFQQGDSGVFLRFTPKPRRNFRLWAGVVDDDEAIGCLALACQHGLYAQLGVCQAAIDRDDDIDWMGGRLHGGGLLFLSLGLGRYGALAQKSIDLHFCLDQWTCGPKDCRVLNGAQIAGQLFEFAGQFLVLIDQNLPVSTELVVILACGKQLGLEVLLPGCQRFCQMLCAGFQHLSPMNRGCQ